MSRVGKKPVPIPGGVTVTVADGVVKVKCEPCRGTGKVVACTSGVCK